MALRLWTESQQRREGTLGCGFPSEGRSLAALAAALRRPLPPSRLTSQTSSASSAQQPCYVMFRATSRQREGGCCRPSASEGPRRAASAGLSWPSGLFSACSRASGDVTVQAWRPVPPGARTGAPAPPTRALCAPGLCRPGQSTLPGAITFLVVAPQGHRKSQPLVSEGQTWCFIGRLCSAPAPLTEKWAFCPHLPMRWSGAGELPRDPAPAALRVPVHEAVSSCLIACSPPDAVLVHARTRGASQRDGNWVFLFLKKKWKNKFFKGHLHHHI